MQLAADFSIALERHMRQHCAKHDQSTGQWITNDGHHGIRIGRSSRDVRLSPEVKVLSGRWPGFARIGGRKLRPEPRLAVSAAFQFPDAAVVPVRPRTSERVAHADDCSRTVADAGD